MTAIYHITHVDNLPAIMQSGRLLCDRLVAERSSSAVCIAHQHIKQRRAARRVEKLDGSIVAAGGYLCDYVPFYFAPRSPMLFTINRGNVAGYSDGQRPILHLVSTAEAAAASGQPWTFTDGHAEMAMSEFFTELPMLATELDWSVMRTMYWRDDTQDPNRKWKRQAEFLVHEEFSWKGIQRMASWIMTFAVKSKSSSVMRVTNRRLRWRPAGITETFHLHDSCSHRKLARRSS